MPIKISIITPSFNQAKYIDRTLHSVKNQTYRNIEHIILDPGSSDGSIAILKKYAANNDKSKFINEPDNGQADAINKGLTIATGEIVTWLNTDDFYLNNNVIDKIVAVFIDNPDIDVVYAKGYYVNQDGKYLKSAFVNKEEKRFKVNLSHSIGILQPALFFKKSVFERVGGLDKFYNLSLDYEYWLRIAFSDVQMKYFDEEIVGATLHDESKTQGQRGFQYHEICTLMKQYYGFVHTNWLERFANYLHDGSDGIINIGKEKQSNEKHIFNSLFRQWNGSSESLYKAFGQNELIQVNEFVDYCRKAAVFSTRRVIVTTASSEYYNQLLNLIAGLHRTSLNDFDLIIIYDLDFTEEQRKYLDRLEKVFVAPYEKKYYFAEYYQPKSYVYKCAAIADALNILQDNDMLIWIDSGVVPLRSIKELFDLVSTKDAFFINHDDRVDQHFFNVNFTHHTALYEIAANSSEAMGEHICSCLMGCKKSGGYEKIFKEAFEFSKNRKVSWWPKHLSQEEIQEKILSENEKMLKSNLISNVLSANKVPLKKIIKIFEYWGHRQDQSIYSILVARYSAPIISAKRYCISTNASSVASKKNWESESGEWENISRCDTLPNEVSHALTYHHRGTFNDLSGTYSKTIATMTTYKDPVSGKKLNIKPANKKGTKKASPESEKTSQILVGPFDREESAHYDETDCVAEIFSSSLAGSIMIDVGAHHGWALAPFLSEGWKIFAFEPDEENRAKLLERLATHKNKSLISLNTCCISNKSVNNVAFYRSEQSTGISGLSAFHESHVEVQRVNTISLADFFENKPLDKVDFLKIDTKGHDLFVLQGFPWERTKPAVIECEYENAKTVPLGYTFHDLANFLVDKGYMVYVSEWHPIIRYGIRHDWNRLVSYPCELANEKGWGNMLAFRDSINEKDLVAAVKRVLKVNSGKTTKLTATISAKSASNINIKPVLISAQSRKVFPGTHFTETSPNQWRYIHSDAAQKLWQTVFNVADSTLERTFVAGVRIKSNRAMTVMVSIGRYGNSEYEGANKRVELEPGVTQTVEVRKKFTRLHNALKVQLDVVHLEDDGGTANLTIDAVSVNETLESIRYRVAEHDRGLQVANHLFRDGDYSAAMGFYLLLHKQRPLKIYSDNALMAIRKLGIEPEPTVDELMQLVD